MTKSYRHGDNCANGSLEAQEVIARINKQECMKIKSFQAVKDSIDREQTTG